MQLPILQSQYMCFTQLVIELYLLCWRQEWYSPCISTPRQTKPLLARLRAMVERLKEASRATAATPAGMAPSSSSLLQSLQGLRLFESSQPRSASPHPARCVNYDAILTTLTTIDAMYEASGLPPLVLQKPSSKSKVVMCV